MEERWVALFKCRACDKITRVEPEMAFDGVPVMNEEMADKMMIKMQRASNALATRRRHICERGDDVDVAAFGWMDFVGLRKIKEVEA